MPRKNELRYFTVEGKLDFPVDMLRYDACWPRSAEDATNIVATWIPRPAMPNGSRSPLLMRTVELATKSENGPTDGHWRSFMWRIVS